MDREMKRQPMKTKSALQIFLVLPVLACCSCSGLHPLKGGKALTTRGPAGTIQQSLAQGDNPAQPSRQSQVLVKVRTYTVPAGARFEPAAVAPGFENSTNGPAITLTAPMLVQEREEARANTELGASQKDTARELGARLASLRSITWVGLGLFVLGLVSLVWPPLKAVVGSVTTSAAILLGGLALVILPTLIVGNELLILGGVGLTAGAWFLAHRHGHLRGLLSAYTATPPANPPSATPAAGQTTTN